MGWQCMPMAMRIGSSSHFVFCALAQLLVHSCGPTDLLVAFRFENLDAFPSSHAVPSRGDGDGASRAFALPHPHPHGHARRKDGHLGAAPSTSRYKLNYLYEMEDGLMFNALGLQVLRLPEDGDDEATVLLRLGDAGHPLDEEQVSHRRPRRHRR